DLSRSRVRLEMDAASLQVTGKGDPPKDVPDVQSTMVSDKVLDVQRFPKILFQSTNVSVTARSGPTATLQVTGTLTIRNVNHSISVPVQVVVAPSSLTATGRFAVNQTDYGI